VQSDVSELGLFLMPGMGSFGCTAPSARSALPPRRGAPSGLKGRSFAIGNLHLPS